MPETQMRLIGLKLGIKEEEDCYYLDYDIGRIALNSLRALQIAVVAIEQSVTGERLLKSLDVHNFYTYVGNAVDEENGCGIVSEADSVSSLQDELQGVIDIVKKAIFFSMADQDVQD